MLHTNHNDNAHMLNIDNLNISFLLYDIHEIWHIHMLVKYFPSLSSLRMIF